MTLARSWLPLAAIGFAVLGLTAGAARTHAADRAHPDVMELFQSQGCSSCPPANRNVGEFADRPAVLVLSWQVTYWDYLGWKDSFGDPAFTARQRGYAHSFGRDEVWTPQVVINGKGDVVGSDRSQLAAALRRFTRGAGGPEIALSRGSVRIAGEGAGATVYLVRYDPRIIQVPIQAGENGGRTLPHRNVVREVAVLGSWNGREHVFPLPTATHPGLKTAVLVQRGRPGPILAAAHD